MLQLSDICKRIDISAVKTNVDIKEIDEMIDFAKENNLICVFSMPCYLPYVSGKLKDREDILVGGVVGFPSGADSTDMKVYQTKWSIENGADEIDMVINVGYLKSKMYDEVKEDIKSVVKEAKNKPVKVILEVGYLTDEEIQIGSKLVLEAGAKFVKTGTGWSGVDTTMHHINLIKEAIGDKIEIKAAGGVKNFKILSEMLENGVTRFGIGQRSIKAIIEELNNM